ncbi:hypothetical protein [Nitratifractor sp.]
MDTSTTALLWYASWPVLIWASYRFVLLNIRHHANLERLEELEARCQETQETKP